MKDELRKRHHLAGLMRGFLGNEEVAVVIATTPQGRVHPVVVLVTDAIAAAIVLPDAASDGWVTAHAFDYPIEVWLDPARHPVRPVVLKTTEWIEEHLLLYARQFWRPPYRPASG